MENFATFSTDILCLMVDVQESYMKLVAALDCKEFLLGGLDFQQAVEPGMSNGDGYQQQESEVAIFCAQLAQIRQALNSIKSRVNTVCARHGAGRWHSFTSFTHPLKGLPGWMGARIRASFDADADTSLYTQAFCKFVQLFAAHPEMLSPFRARHPDCGSPRSLHLCELPGAFVLALKSVLEPSMSNSLDWHVNSLNPHWEWSPPGLTLSEDTLLAENEARMAFGWDQSGDLLSSSSLDDAYLAHRFDIRDGDGAHAEHNKFELVTADGGFDCTDDPSSQECLLRPLIECEIKIALKCLRRGGTFLLKAFTFFEPETVQLLAHLCFNFGEVRCVKPPSSKPGNSEMYLLCLDFKSSENGANQHLDNLMMKRIVHAARALAGHQIGFIDFNLTTFRRLSQHERTIISMEKCALVERFGSRVSAQIRTNLPFKFCSRSPSWRHNLLSNTTRKTVENGEHSSAPTTTTYVLEPKFAEQFLAWLRSNNNARGDGSVVFARIDDAQKRAGHSISNSMFSRAAWPVETEVQDICAEELVKWDQNYSFDCTKRNKMDWLDLLIKTINTDVPSFELKFGPSEGILSRFSASIFVTLCAFFEKMEIKNENTEDGGNAKLCFTSPRADFCVDLAKFLTNMRVVHTKLAASDPRWTLLKFVPAKFFEAPSTVAEGGKSMAEHIVELNSHLFSSQRM